MKVCTRCGRELPEDEFYEVKYKNKESKYRYSVCRTCMAIEQRRRRLLRDDPESEQLVKIEALYDKHKAAGRSVPTELRRSPKDLENEIDNLLNT